MLEKVDSIPGGEADPPALGWLIRLESRTGLGYENQNSRKQQYIQGDKSRQKHTEREREREKTK